MLLSLLSSSLVAAAAPLTLVKNNQPNGAIVVDVTAAAPEKAAAHDLQLYVRKVSGVKLPLVNDPTTVSGVALHVGKTTATQESDLPDSKTNPEAYKIAVRDNAIHFNGRYPTATASAVYAFLQEELGVRWFAPGDDWEYIPLQTMELVVDVETKLTVPNTSPHIWSGHGWTPSWGLWNKRNRAVQAERIPWRNFQNNIYRIFPPSKYGKTNPEYYPLINGKRWIPSSDNDALWWPSMGNKDVQRITVEYIRNYFDRNPEEDTFSLGMDDVIYMCGDENSRAMDSAPTDYDNRKFSSRFYKFINIIAREVKKTHPDKYIGVLLYYIARDVPPDVPQIEDNVFGYLAETSAQWFDPATKAADKALTLEWSKRMSHLLRYEYYGMGTFTPRVYPHLMDEQIKYDHSLGFKGSYIEMYTFLPHTAPMIWALAQLQWDTQLNIDQLLNEFYQKMYGDAAPTMKQYYDLLEDSWLEDRPGKHGWVHANIVRQALSISPEAAVEGKALLDQAYNQARLPLERRRIDVVSNGLQYAAYAVQGYALSQAISATRSIDANNAPQLTRNIVDFYQLTAERDFYWKEALTRQDLLGENLRGLHGMKLDGSQSYLQTDASALDGSVNSITLQLLNWLSENKSPQNDALAKQLLSIDNELMRSTLQTWHWIKSNGAKSLLANSDFQFAQNAPTKATKQLPANWSAWSRFESASSPVYAASPGPNGQPAIRVESPAVSGLGNLTIVMQDLSVKKGQRYFATVWLRSIDATPGQLRLNFLNANGLMAGEDASALRQSTVGDWQQVMITAVAPETAIGVRFMLATDNGSVEFSAPALYEIP